MVLLKQWDTILGALHTRVFLHKIGDDHLILNVAHPSLAQELHMMGDLLKKKICEGLAQAGTPHTLTSIQLRIAPQVSGSTFAATRKSIRQTQPAPKTPQPLTLQERGVLETVKNVELRDALETFFVACKQRCSLDERHTLTPPSQRARSSERLRKKD